MPSPLPSSFASAAAGNNQDLSNRRDGASGGEWTRSRMNGATQTFRRPSLATNVSQNRENSSTSSAPTPSAAYVPPHLNSNYQSSRNGPVGESRYSKDQLLSIFKSQRDSGSLEKYMNEAFVADWNPLEESSSPNGAWGKKEDHKDSSVGPEVCWDHGGQYEPLGLTDLTSDEKELFTTTVNSPLKPPPSSASKDNAGGPVGGRKSSISHGGSFNISSPTSTRPGARRRETAESIGNPQSPTTNTPSTSRFFRDEPAANAPPPALLRRKTDFREPSVNTKPDDKEKGKDSSGAELASPFGSIKRSTTNPLSAGLAGPTSPWPATSQNTAFSPMGAFGNFSLGSSTATQSTSTEKRPGFGSVRSESRFKGLLSKDSSEDVGASAKEKSTQKNLEKLAEDEDGSRSASPWGDSVKTRGARSETNPFAEEPRAGSAALGGSQDAESPPQSVDQLGFSAFGMTSGLPGFHDLIQGREPGNDAPANLQGFEPTSPTNTNPYQSPRGEKVDVDDVDTDGSDVQRTHLPGLSGLREESSAAPFGSLRRGGSGLDLSAGDRSQTSSAGAGRNFSGLGGLGGVPGLGGSGAWSSGAPIGTPTRDRGGFAGFGDPIFGSMAEMQSPSLAALSGGGFFGSHSGLNNPGSIGRSSKMGSLFPTALQEQMQNELARQEPTPTEGAGRQSAERATALDTTASIPSAHPPSTSAGSATTPLASSGDILQSGPTQPAGTPSSSTMPTAQQRTMVMPDRMRWIYRDPQGNIQGPWSGLEMHDWFKAGFFTAELQVKKLEDPEFEPLAQLVRRIGNSREPFLVPQIGIPHGPEPAPAGPWGAGTQPGTAQPPFANSFPTFGTTLTAEQQNALERRKQEEQYLMARQKEHLAQQQVLMKQMQMQGGAHGMHAHQLQHHSSAHSLHSQPSFGSITSPSGGYQPSPIQGPIQPPQSMPGYFDGSMRPNPLSSLGPQLLGSDLMGGPEELPGLMERLNVNRPGAFPFNNQAAVGARQQDGSLHPQQVAAMLQDRARLQQEQEQYDSMHPDGIFDQQARDERLRQFHALRSQEEDPTLRSGEGLPTHPASTGTQNETSQNEDSAPISHQQEAESVQATNNEPLSLAQQVQKAASAQRQQQHDQAEAEAAWAQAESGMPHPFPPPPSASPLPAPAAQRNRQNVADALAATSRSQNQTPVDTPMSSVAPWAKDTTEAPKGPSLKEIQEAEARSAALREEVAAAARRAQLLAEQERLSQAQTTIAPGLPSTANWASSGSPVTQGSTTASVWAKPLAGKPPVALNSQTAKKTLAQIQKEEEARKQRLAAANSGQVAASASPTSAAGKRYADLAGKAPIAQPATSGAWTTVGASGKAKVPTAAPVAPRSTSGTTPVAQAPKARPVAPTRTATVGAAPASNANKATEELTKWAKMTLGRGLNSTINVDDFVQQLLLLPAETDIISDSVYANSQTLDGRRFAEEFIRRRKLADKGIIDPVSSNAFSEQKGSTGGWSEVAKKSSSASSNREEDASTAAFKVVATKKKGKR